MVLTKFMRLSLMKAAHVVVSSAAYRKIRVARIPVGPDGVEEVHAAFLNESRTRGRVQRSVQEIRVAGQPMACDVDHRRKAVLTRSSQQRSPRARNAGTLTKKRGPP
jgi:hypothetical protein